MSRDLTGLMKGAGIGPLSQDAMAALSKISKTRSYAEGKILFQRGDESGEMFLVVKGWIKLSVVSEDGTELVLRYAGPNALMGEIGVLGNRPRTADAKAVKDVELVAIEKVALLNTFGRHPEIPQALLACLCDRICATTDQLEALALTSLECRLARLVVQLTKTATVEQNKSIAKIHMPYTQSEIAEIVTGSRQQVNIALKKMETIGAIIKHTRTQWAVNLKIITHLAAGQSN